MSEIFCAEFSDGVATRMTIWHAKDHKTLDLKRGVRLARYAYETHVHNRERRIGFGGPPVTVPPIVSAHFENEDGTILERYTAERVAAS
jgi:hypothetical protein